MHSPGSRVSAHVVVTKANIVNKNVFISPFHFLSFYIWAAIIWDGKSHWLIRFSWPGCAPSQDLAHPLMGGKCWEPALMLCQPYSAMPKALGCYQHLSRCQCKAQHCGCCDSKMSSSSARPNTLSSPYSTPFISYFDSTLFIYFLTILLYYFSLLKSLLTNSCNLNCILKPF